MKKILYSVVLLVPFYAEAQLNDNVSYPYGNAGNSGTYNSSFGDYAGLRVTGTSNTFLGRSSGTYTTTGSNNTYVGMAAGSDNETGSFNAFFGYRAGGNAEGSGNIFLGAYAGYNETGSNKLYISNSSTATPLIYGDFSSGILIVNGKLGVGIQSPQDAFHVRGTTQSYVRIEKSSSDYEAGIQLNKAGSAMFYMYSDNGSDAFKIQATGLTGEADATPRLELPKANKNLYMALSGGNVGIGTTSPSEVLDVNGGLRVRALTQNDSYTRLLVSDVNGKLFWSQSLHVNEIDFGNDKKMRLPGNNIYIGRFTGLGNTVGYANIFIGDQAGIANTIGYDNTFAGYRAGTNNVSGAANTFVGALAGYNNVAGYGNTGIGEQAGNGVTSDYNTFIGSFSAKNTSSGNQNTVVGALALQENITGSRNIAIGYAAGPATGLSNLVNTVTIGHLSKVNISNGFILGNSSHNIGIRQTAPDYALHVQNAYCDGNTWFNASDKNLKENFRAITNESILAKVMELTIEKWNYIGEKGTSHIGPTAQDFNKVFNLGGNDKAIASVDEAGVALAAIQELNQKTEKLEKIVTDQQHVIASLLVNKVNDSEIDDKSVMKGTRLHQNSPNPFQRETRISMTLPESVAYAVIYIYDLSGKALEQYVVTGRGDTSLNIEGGTFSPGIYLYTLIADGQATDVKRMILTE